MKLWFKDLALHDYGELQIIGRSSIVEPADAPQRKRITIRCRLNFWAQSYSENKGLVDLLSTALKNNQEVLKWQDDNATTYLGRTVTVGDDEQAEEANAQGTYKQAVTFSFWYYDHDLATNCLPASYTGVGGSNRPNLDMGAVEKWSEALEIELADAMKNVRRRCAGVVAASGRFQGNTNQSLSDRRDALLAKKDLFISEMIQGSPGRFQYGTFDKVIRIARFTCEIDQPMNAIVWSISGSFTQYPDETDYTWLDYTIGQRETKAEGIVIITLSGRIGATSEIKARVKLASLISGPNSLVPAGYVQLNENIVPRTVESRTGNNIGGDGAAFIELMFDLEFRDTTTLPISYKATNALQPLDLGIVERFSDRYSAQLFDEMRSIRKRAGGVVTAQGKIYMPDSLSLDAKRAALKAKKDDYDAAFNGKKDGQLVYGEIFNKTVRVLDWNCEINRLRNCLEWNLSAVYTRFPNESNYAICEFNLSPREDKIQGTVVYILSGRIGAPSSEMAYAKLNQLRTSLIPTGFVMASGDPTERNVSTDSDGNGDGASFIELTFNEEHRKVDGNILQWDLKITNADIDDGDIKTGFIRTTYSGTILAQGSSFENAFATGRAMALSLGDDKFPFKVSESITENERLFQTSGGIVFVPVDFVFEYQRKGQKIYLEVSAERSNETFGRTVETVSGFIVAPDLASAAAVYATDVRNVAPYVDQLILNEKTPTLARQTIRDSGSQDDRFGFSFTVHIDKATDEIAMEYRLTPSLNFLTLEKITSVRGTVYAASKAAAETFLDSFLNTLALGSRINSERGEINQTGPKVTGLVKAKAFMGFEFNETYSDRLTGQAGILECDVTEQLQYSGTRWVIKPLPDAPSIVQNCGVQEGRRVVTGNVTAATESACLAWAKKCRTLLLTGGASGDKFEEPPQISTRRRFVPRVDGTPAGNGANVRIFESQFTFSEILPDLPFVP